MKWTKSRGHQLFSAMLASALLACAIMVSVKTSSFQDRFSQAETKVPHTITDPPFELMPDVQQAKADLDNPPTWTRASLFVPEGYIVGRDKTPIKIREGSIHNDSVSGQPIPNQWFLDHHLSPLDGNAPFQDTDKDGFTSEDEWRYRTDPNDKDSHPPYDSKLFLKQCIRVPCRLVFKIANGDANKPETLDFQVDTIDLRQPTVFLKLGEMVPNTHLKLERYKPKEIKNLKINGMLDVSELTMFNTETNEPVVLVRGIKTDVPDVYALFDYQWPSATGEFRVRRLQDFGLRPESNKDSLYRLMSVNDSEAVIRLPDGELRTIVRDPRKAAK